MPQFCDVALPVPLDMTFTYQVDGMKPVVGGRVLVPFREKRLPGVVVALHDKQPTHTAKLVLRVLDPAPLLDETLLKLGRWIAQYYLAPLGEVLRTMLPLSAEWKRTRGFRIAASGVSALGETKGPTSAKSGSRRAGWGTTYDIGLAVLEYLALRENGDAVRESTLRSATGATRELLQALLRKKWISPEDLSESREARRTIDVAVLAAAPGEPTKRSRPLNANQQALLDALASAGGRLPLAHLRAIPAPQTTIKTLIKRGLVNIVEEPAEFKLSKARVRPALDFAFTVAQCVALNHINAAVAAKTFSSTLIHGITGSGKTAVYLAAMQEVLQQGRGAIMLVPEIGLTPAAAAQLHQVFGDAVAILHSGLSDDERAEQWHRIRRGEARVVVGTRSAVFAPVHDPALIVVDEEHDHSYKQEETPRYHARDVAVMRAKMSNVAVVLGSATPSLESYFNAQQGKYALIELPDRVERRPLPEVELIDMRQEFQETGHQRLLSRKLAAEIAACLERGEQAMLLLNRRGFSAFVMCRACGQTVQCRNCAIALTYHKRTHRLECHYCGYRLRVPQACPKCHSEYVQFLGAGSEKLEEMLHAQFPQARIGRLDRDTVRGRHDFERMLNAMNAGELDLLAGTQMIAKGHDLHGVTLVGVVGADAALAFPDFRSAERTFQLLTQVAGRAGRGDSPGKVILQTFFPDHYAVQFATRHDFNGFYEKELKYRNAMRYPPFSAVANVLVRSDRLEEALKYSGMLGQWFRSIDHEGVHVLGPAAAPVVRLKNEYRFHLLLKSASREKLNGLLRAMLAYAAGQKIPRTNVTADVDAFSLL